VNAKPKKLPKLRLTVTALPAILALRAASRVSAPLAVQYWALAVRRSRVICYQIAKSAVQENHELSTISADISDGVSANPQVENATGRTAAGQSVQNTILLQIPDNEFEAIQPHLKFIPLELATCLHREHEFIRAVYFMNRGIVSMLVETDDGRSVEVGVCGREDMVGLGLAAGLERLTHSVIVQVPGDGFQVDAQTLRRVLHSSPGLWRILVLRLGIRAAQLEQNAACNRLHNVRQRLARWLLVTHDLLDSDVIQTTHEFLSKMIGTDRPTVSVAVADLEREGILEHRRGSIVILDREKLERQSCACYGVIRQFSRELGIS
jgi:CRP-like cAMP-binding protein